MHLFAVKFVNFMNKDRLKQPLIYYFFYLLLVTVWFVNTTIPVLFSALLLKVPHAL